MGTLIKMSDGDEIYVENDYDDIVTAVGAAFRRDFGASTDDRGRIIENGFLAVDTSGGQEIMINVRQLVSLRSASSERRPPGKCWAED